MENFCFKLSLKTCKLGKFSNRIDYSFNKGYDFIYAKFIRPFPIANTLKEFRIIVLLS